MRRLIGVLTVLVIAGCGSSAEDRLNLRTPGAHTGAAVPAATSSPNPTPTPEPTETPEAEEDTAREPVTRAERRVIQGWSDSLQRGKLNAAAGYFTVPTLVSDATPGWQYLDTKAKVVAFNRGLECGARLVRVRRGSDGFVVGIFRLVERRGAGADCGGGVGETTAVAFLIRQGRITQWVQIDPSLPGAGGGGSAPAPTPTPSPLPGSEPRQS